MIARRARVVVIAIVLLGAVTVLAADDMSVVVDPRADFSKFHTFAMRREKIDTPRPELDNPLFMKKLRTVIRAALAARGLKETTGVPDLVVDYVLAGEDINTTRRGAARGMGPQPVRFTEGTLVIDLSRPGQGDPVWRGTYRDEESTGSKLVEKVPDDARKLLARYPKGT